MVFTPYIRGYVIDCDFRKNLEQKEYLPKSYEAKNVKTLTKNEIDQLKLKANGNTYYRFNLQLKRNKTYRLLSVSTQEELVGIITDNGAEATIKKGDDDFFYVTANKNCSFSHIVKVSDKIKTYKDAIPEGHQIRKTLDEYMDVSQGFKFVVDKVSETLPKYNPKKHQEWMEAVYNERLGACRHRASAVQYKLLNEGIEKDDIRVISIKV